MIIPIRLFTQTRIILPSVLFFSITANNIINEVQKFAPMTFNELRDNLFENYEAGAISDDEMVQIFEQISVYLDLKTITNFAKVNGITYNGALKRRTHKITIDKVTFIINNF